MGRIGSGEAGFTLVELTVTIVVMTIIVLAAFELFTALVSSTIVAKQEAIAITLATNQMEYLKTLPYGSLAVQGGSIYATTEMPAAKTQTVNGTSYKTTTSISYIDDAYDGCGSYPNLATEKIYCRNYPPPSGAPSVDQNPADYKIVHVAVTNKSGNTLASEDTEISPNVAETASATGALFVKVTDNSGNPISGATVTAVDSSLSPTVNVSDSTDANGEAVFYDLPPDSNANYVISASYAGYSILSTIPASGSLQATYPNQKIIAQQSSSVSLVLAPQGANSLLMQATDTSGNPITGAKLYVKGGYKKYTSTTDYSYYYDNYYSNYDSGTVSDTRSTTDSSGYAALTNLAPVNNYLFCNSDATTTASSPSSATNCAVGSTKYYLAAAIPYTGNNSLMPIVIPTYLASNPPKSTFAYGGGNYLQEVQLMLTTSATFPRVYTMNPYDLSLAAATNINSFPITINGYNLSGATVKLTENGNTYTGTGCSSSATQISCTLNLTGIAVGTAQLTVTNSSGTLTLPYVPQLGGFNVNQ